MPYIPLKNRPSLVYLPGDDIDPGSLTPGELTFVFCDMVDQWVGDVPDYARLSTAIGALECAKLEIYRRIVAPHEDKAMERTGDVFFHEQEEC